MFYHKEKDFDYISPIIQNSLELTISKVKSFVEDMILMNEVFTSKAKKCKDFEKIMSFQLLTMSKFNDFRINLFKQMDSFRFEIIKYLKETFEFDKVTQKLVRELEYREKQRMKHRKQLLQSKAILDKIGEEIQNLRTIDQEMRNEFIHYKKDKKEKNKLDEALDILHENLSSSEDEYEKSKLGSVQSSLSTS